jgi:hypothetical protein
MVELQQKYNLRPRETSTTSAPPKNILLRNKENEAVVTKHTVKKQVAQGKKFEAKATQAKKEENIETPTSTRECEKTVGVFSLEKKKKFKIPMPLFELAKNLIYKK